MYKEWLVTVPALTGEEERKAYIYVPDGSAADDERRYPVLYMFDGQNLFRDADASYGKSWGLLDFLTGRNIPLIVAAAECSHHGEEEPCGGRLSEYSPWDFSSRSFGDIRGRGELTMDWFINEFKPYIDETFPTLPDREHTFISGSSMGGLMTVYALLAHNDVFSRGAALSPSFGFCPGAVKELIRTAELGETVLYMDNGSLEMRSQRSRRLYGEITAALMRKGIYVQSRVIPGGFHSEASWERQIPFFIDTLFYGLDEE